ncbi:hypothetical protein SEUCBS139899_003393 [Sporothrix eucalyptigena]
MPSAGALISTVGFGTIIPRYVGRKWGFQIATSLVCIGVVLQTFPNNWALTYLDQSKAYSWKVANSIQFVPAAAFFILVFFLPESPRWLAAKYPDDDLPMLKSLAWLRGKTIDHELVTDEAKEVREYNIWARENESTNPLNLLLNKRLFKRLLYANVPLLQMQLCGVQILQIYASVIYQSLGLQSQHHALLLTACTQILYAAAALGSSYFVEKIGRRKCIMTASYIWIVNIAIIFGLALGYESAQNMVANGFVAAFIILNNTIYWLFATGPAVVYVNEILPTHSRELGVGLANAVPVGIAVALGQEWPVATARIGPWSYLILLCTCTCGTVLCWFFIKEPKGLSIERIDVLFGERDHVEEVEESKASSTAIESIVWSTAAYGANVFLPEDGNRRLTARVLLPEDGNRRLTTTISLDTIFHDYLRTVLGAVPRQSTSSTRRQRYYHLTATSRTVASSSYPGQTTKERNKSSGTQPSVVINQWKTRWQYDAGSSLSARSLTAQTPCWTAWAVRRRHLHLTKAESSLLTQFRTGHIGPRAYLYRRKAADPPTRRYNVEEETPAHVLLSCTTTPPRPPGWPQAPEELNRRLKAGLTVPKSTLLGVRDAVLVK